jgi:ssRNA-specific RNase YbeY (16S rRNA maturation enzyme)
MTKAEREAYLNRVAARSLAILKQRATVRVFCAKNDDMDLLAVRYLHKKKPLVDVLAFPEASFPAPDVPKTRPLLGEVYVNDDAFRRDLGHMKFLTVHGVLHLLGKTHARKRDTIEMQRLETRLCQQIALPE